MEKIAVFPGSFDPFTVGHDHIVRRALPLFDKIIIAIGYNSNKSGFFPLALREEWIRTVYQGINMVSVDHYQGLTIDFCRKVQANYLIRGLRTSADFEFESNIAQMNKMMAPQIESVFILTAPEYTSINSTIVRDIFRHGGDIRQFIPQSMDIRDFKP